MVKEKQSSSLRSDITFGLQTRSLPADGGPRISMKVRRELGLEPPAKNRTHSVPGGEEDPDFSIVAGSKI